MEKAAPSPAAVAPRVADWLCRRAPWGGVAVYVAISLLGMLLGGLWIVVAVWALENSHPAYIFIFPAVSLVMVTVGLPWVARRALPGTPSPAIRKIAWVALAGIVLWMVGTFFFGLWVVFYALGSFVTGASGKDTPPSQALPVLLATWLLLNCFPTLALLEQIKKARLTQ